MTRQVRVAVCGHLPTACDYLLRQGVVQIDQYVDAAELADETAYHLILIYFAVKKYGMAIVEDVVPEDKFKKINDILKNNTEKVELILFILYFLPLVPKDFLTYIGSLFPIRLGKFLFITLFARFPAVISSTIVGDSIIEGDIQTIIWAYIITYAISIFIAYMYNKNFKKNMREENNQEREETNG